MLRHINVKKNILKNISQIYDSLCYDVDIGTMWHYVLFSCDPSQSIGLFWGVRCSGVECDDVFVLLIPW